MERRVARAQGSRKIGPLLLATACTTAPVAPVGGPYAVARRHADAAAVGDAAALGATLHPEVRDHFDPAAVTPTALPVPPSPTGVTVVDGALQFDCTTAPCRLETPLPVFDRHDTPETAWALLGRALRRGDAEGLLVLAPARLRAGLDPAQLASRLAESAQRAGWLDLYGQLDAQGQWVADGPTVMRRTAGRHYAVLSREASGWVLVDLR